MRGATVEVKCNCGTMFTARVADRKRGWGKFCSKSCKASNCKNGMKAFSGRKVKRISEESVHDADHEAGLEAAGEAYLHECSGQH